MSASTRENVLISFITIFFLSISSLCCAFSAAATSLEVTAPKSLPSLPALTIKDKTTDRYKYDVVANDKLAFDHPLVIVSGISRLKNKLEYTDIVFNMMPEYFTLGELQQVYELILGKKLLDPAFRRIIANKVEKTDKMRTGGGHRPSILFTYKHSDII